MIRSGNLFFLRPCGIGGRTNEPSVMKAMHRRGRVEPHVRLHLARAAARVSLRNFTGARADILKARGVGVDPVEDSELEIQELTSRMQLMEAREKTDESATSTSSPRTATSRPAETQADARGSWPTSSRVNVQRDVPGPCHTRCCHGVFCSLVLSASSVLKFHEVFQLVWFALVCDVGWCGLRSLI